MICQVNCKSLLGKLIRVKDQRIPEVEFFGFQIFGRLPSLDRMENEGSFAGN